MGYPIESDGISHGSRWDIPSRSLWDSMGYPIRSHRVFHRQRSRSRGRKELGRRLSDPEPHAAKSDLDHCMIGSAFSFHTSCYDPFGGMSSENDGIKWCRIGNFHRISRLTRFDSSVFFRSSLLGSYSSGDIVEPTPRAATPISCCTSPPSVSSLHCAAPVAGTNHVDTCPRRRARLYPCA